MGARKAQRKPPCSLMKIILPSINRILPRKSNLQEEEFIS
jgi:hypothetical protein